MSFEDLGDQYGMYDDTQSRYRVRCAVVDEDRSTAKGSVTGWSQLEGRDLPLESGPVLAASTAAGMDRYPFLSMEFQVDRGDGWSATVTVYMARRSGRIVAVDR